jgi:hypothetical protein
MKADVQMRLFAQSLTGDVKKWYKGLRAASVLDLTTFQRSFLDRWEVKKNPLQILSEYENIRRNQGETIQDYCTTSIICTMQFQPILNPHKV